MLFLWRDVVNKGVKIARIPAEGLCPSLTSISQESHKPYLEEEKCMLPLKGQGFILSHLIPSKVSLEPISNLNYPEIGGEGGVLRDPLSSNLKDTQIEFAGAAQTLKWDSTLKSAPTHQWVLLLPWPLLFMSSPCLNLWENILLINSSQVFY